MGSGVGVCGDDPPGAGLEKKHVCGNVALYLESPFLSFFTAYLMLVSILSDIIDFLKIFSPFLRECVLRRIDLLYLAKILLTSNTPVARKTLQNDVPCGIWWRWQPEELLEQ